MLSFATIHKDDQIKEQVLCFSMSFYIGGANSMFEKINTSDLIESATNELFVKFQKQIMSGITILDIEYDKSSCFYPKVTIKTSNVIANALKLMALDAIPIISTENQLQGIEFILKENK